jgi:eukaryotic-like serine/threonine-protein kinase
LLTPGSSLHSYIIEEKLGEGGFGVVYRARHKHLPRIVAIKEINKLFEVHPRSLDQFAREAELLASLDHPALPKVIDYFDQDGHFYLVMEYIPGKNLADYLLNLAGYRVDEREALRLIGPILDALEYLHGQNPPIIHRDIKPGNIRISESDRRVFLVDFGLAKAYRANTSTTMVVGVTHGFSPLEQYGNGKTDVRSDMYALGATLYTMLCGQSPPAAPERMLKDPLVLLRKLNPLISPQVEKIIVRLLAMDADDRYQTIADLRRDVQRLSSPKDTLPLSDDTIVHIGKENTLPKVSRFGVAVGGVIILLIIGVLASLVAAIIVTGRQPTDRVSPAPVTISPATSVAQISTHTPSLPTTTALAAQATAQMQAIASTTAAISNASQIVFGPYDGDLVHDDDKNLEIAQANLDMQDFIAEVEFSNPYTSTQTNTWDYGFLFRMGGENTQYRLFVRANSQEKLYLNNGSADGKLISSGANFKLNVLPNGSNRLRLIVTGSTGYFYINGVYITTLNISGRLVAGDIAIGIGFEPGAELKGASTRYTGFTIWAPPAVAQAIGSTATAQAIARAQAMTRAQTQTAIAQQVMSQAAQLLEDSRKWGGEVFSDTFEDSTNPKGWLVGPYSNSDVTGTLSLIPHAYSWAITANQSSALFRLSPADFVTDTFRLSVKILPDNASSGNRTYGVSFRGKQVDNVIYCYAFVISEATQTYRFIVYAPNKSGVIRGSTTNLDINRREFNELTVIAQGSQFWLYINGSLVEGAPFLDDTLPSNEAGSTGLYIEFSQGEHSTYVFDDFDLRKP